MAYVSQEMKKKLAPAIKAVCAKYGIKATVAVRHHSTLVCNIKSGKIDLIGNYNKVAPKKYNGTEFHPSTGTLQVNEYWFQEHFDGKAKQFLSELVDAMKGPDFFDHTDTMTDYFHRSHYIDINVGDYNKPYEVV